MKEVMKMRSLFLGGLMTLALGLGLSACGDDEKENEIIPEGEEVVIEKAWYITGKVSNAAGPISGATVECDSEKATTDAQGAYTFTVKEAKTYKLKFSAKDMESYEADAVVAANAENGSVVTVSVTLAAAIDYSKAATEEVKAEEETVVEVPTQEESKPAEEQMPATVEVPAGGADEGTKISAVEHEEASTAAPATTSTQTEQAAVSNVAVKTEPADAVAKKDIVIAVSNSTVASTASYFDPANMVFMKDEATTRAPKEYGKVSFKDGKYQGTIKQGDKIAGKYSVRVNMSKKADAVKTSEFNTINGKAETLKIENLEYNALRDVKLTIVEKLGWEYSTNAAAALKAVGAGSELAGVIAKMVEAAEGAQGVYTKTREVTVNVSGNHALYYTSKAKTQIRNYTFKVMVGSKSVNVTVKVKAYLGSSDSYQMNPVGVHSGGSGHSGGTGN